MRGLCIFTRMKKYLILLSVLWMSCGGGSTPEAKSPVVKLAGQTMGTTYHITYIDSNSVDYQKAIDSVLVEVNHSMSTYDSTSIISEFNRQKDTINFVRIDKYFSKALNLSMMAYNTTGGAFDPTVMPLVKAYGFGPGGEIISDKKYIDSLRQFVGFDLVEPRVVEAAEGRSEFLRKRKVGTMLDMSAVAKGYGVDVVGMLLEAKGIQNYMVEIGGEVRCRGVNPDSLVWTIGIDKPIEGSPPGQNFNAIIHLDNLSMATSGNYRNYKEKDGMKYVHTINPKTGYPEINNTLSVSVVSYSCGLADAYATALMVLGVDKGYPIATSIRNIEAYFIYVDQFGQMQTKVTPGLRNVIEKPKK